MRRLARIAAAVTGATLTAVVTAAVVSPAGGSSAAAGNRQGQASGDGVIVGHASDRLPSTTAQDWVTYADHVVVVSAVSEREIAPSRSETERGEGIVGRQVTLRVDKVLWSRAAAPQKPPTSWEYNAAGWQFSDGDTGKRRKMVLEERPRVEAGHSYVMAIVWQGPRCAEGDGRTPGKWLGLGEGSEIPFDAGILGNGEEAGRVVRQQGGSPAAAALAADENPDVGLEEQLAGGSASALVSELKAAAPATPQEFGAASRTAGDAAACD
ncbi:hypothetical protein [Streptomyces sp. BK239]|uniref:hypothetical protein n=1 Tax=Streptomyces sp. BK239 TaxID=2512155 RepID=UPI0010E716D9|nr:hypothetical protein [Streptomyces sp. BK239]RZU15117.1 hypothetical protein EV567_4101 [Streptomyces sp. BK239]